MTTDWSSVPWPGWSLAVACVLAATTLSRCVAPRFRPSPLLAVATAVVLRPWSRAAMLPVAALSSC